MNGFRKKKDPGFKRIKKAMGKDPRLGSLRGIDDR